MRVTVLGSCGAWPEAGRACSGFLVEYDGFRLVLDLGYATLPRLLTHVSADELDAVVITHGHPDHCADLHPLFRARVYRGHGGAGDHGLPAGGVPPELVYDPPLPLYAPAEVVARVGALSGPDGAAELRKAFEVTEIEPGAAWAVGPFELRTWDLPHWLPNAGVRVSAGEKVLAYTGDTGRSEQLVELAADADLFIAEATGLGEPTTPYLLSAAAAGEYAARARASRLLLTHFWPGLDRAVSVAEAQRHYGGEVLAAEEDLVLEL